MVFNNPHMRISVVLVGHMFSESFHPSGLSTLISDPAIVLGYQIHVVVGSPPENHFVVSIIKLYHNVGMFIDAPEGIPFVIESELGVVSSKPVRTFGDFRKFAPGERWGTVWLRCLIGVCYLLGSQTQIVYLEFVDYPIE